MPDHRRIALASPTEAERLAGLIAAPRLPGTQQLRIAEPRRRTAVRWPKGIPQQRTTGIPPLREGARWPTRADSFAEIVDGFVRHTRDLALAGRQAAALRPRGARQARPRARRTAASSTTSSADPGGASDSDSEPPPPSLTLWRHSRWGSCSPALLRLLVRAQADEAQR